MSHHIQAGQRKTCSLQELSKCAKNLDFSEKICECKHEIGGSGAIFFQSLGILYCNECKGTQPIRKPIK